MFPLLIACATNPAANKETIRDEFSAITNDSPSAQQACATENTQALEVQLGELALTVAEEPMLSELAALDANDDGILNTDDIDVETQSFADTGAIEEPDESAYQTHQDQKLRELVGLVGNSFYPTTGVDKDQAKVQQSYFADFVDLYAQVKYLDRTTDEWQKITSPTTSGGTLAPGRTFLNFSPETWSAAAAEFTPGAAFSEANMHATAIEMYNTIQGLQAETFQQLTTDTSIDPTTCNTFTGFSYDETKIPPLLRGAVYEMVGDYTAATKWLYQDQMYVRIGCDSSQSDTACTDPTPAEFTAQSLAIIPTNFDENYYTYCSSYYCFTADMLVKTQTGSVSFAQLQELVSQGKPLPFVASYDEQTGEVIYQQPVNLIDHGFVDTKLTTLSLIADDGEMTELTVTPNHKLLVDRNGSEVWVPVGELTDNDNVIGPDGEQLYVNWEGSEEILTNEALFNLTFAAAKTGMEPTYLVSSDGDNWVVAHNMKI